LSGLLDFGPPFVIFLHVERKRERESHTQRDTLHTHTGPTKKKKKKKEVAKTKLNLVQHDIQTLRYKLLFIYLFIYLFVGFIHWYQSNMTNLSKLAMDLCWVVLWILLKQSLVPNFFNIFRNQRTIHGFQFFEGKFSESKNRQFQFRLLHKSEKEIALKISFL
jgi:hypothetical protein